MCEYLITYPKIADGDFSSMLFSQGNCTQTCCFRTPVNCRAGSNLALVLIWGSILEGFFPDQIENPKVKDSKINYIFETRKQLIGFHFTDM